MLIKNTKKISGKIRLLYLKTDALSPNDIPKRIDALIDFWRGNFGGKQENLSKSRKVQEVFQKIRHKFRENAPDWLFAIAQMLWWALHSKYPAIKLFPARGYWIATWKGERLCFPTPRIAILAHFSRSYIQVYEHYFRVEKDETVLDVGAYVGSFSMAAANRAKKVLAIEPDPKSYACLQRNVSKLANVQTVRKAVWNSKKKLKLYLDPRYPIANSVVIPPGSKFINVEADTLDNIASELGFDKVDFIKMNIEGAELEALQGAEQVLKSAKKVVMDAHHVRNREATWPQVCQFLRARGFKTRIIEAVGIVYAWRN